MGVDATVQVAGDLDAWITAGVDVVIERAEAALKERGVFRLALAGGNTPQQVYERLAGDPRARALDWSKIWVLFGDERCVAPSDPSSNAGMAMKALLDHISIPEANIVRMRGEDPPYEAATSYETALAGLLGGDPGTGSAPKEPLDLVLLGLGPNGHTASLFPGLTWSVLPNRWVIGLYVEVMKSWRLTLTPLVINASRHIVFLVEGSGKTDMVAQILEGPSDPVVLPAQNIVGATWLLDHDAAAGLKH